MELKIQVCLSQDIQELLYLHVQLQYTAELHPKSGARALSRFCASYSSEAFNPAANPPRRAPTKNIGKDRKKNALVHISR